jgi:hypothetical protein
MDEIESVPESATIIAAPILHGKDHREPSAFTPESLRMRDSGYRF